MYPSSTKLIIKAELEDRVSRVEGGVKYDTTKLSISFWRLFKCAVPQN